MQEHDNLHTRLNPQEDPSAPHQPHHPGTSQYPPLQQHYSYPPLPPTNTQWNYPSYNPQVTYPHPYGDHTRQGQYVGPVQLQGNSSQDALRNITMRIDTQFGCYMCLVYVELVLSIFSVIMSIIAAASQVHATALLVTLNVLLTLPMLGGCILAIQAKSNLNKSKQYIAFTLFIIATIVSFALSVMVGILTQWVAISIIGLVTRSFIGLILVFGAYSLYQLMRDRDRIISMQGNNLFDPVVQA